MLRSQRLVGLVTAVTAVATLLGGCTSDEPDPAEVAASEATERRFEACIRLGEDIAAALQGYVDQFAVEGDGVPAGPAAEEITIGDLQAAANEFAGRRVAIGCGPREFQVVLNRALEDVEGQGPYAAAVAARLREEVVESTGPSETVTVAPGDDLAAAVHDADPGAVVRLEAGTHDLDEPLVLLRNARLVGAGQDETVIVSSAPDAVMVHGGGGTLRLEGLTLEHDGPAAASVLVIAAGGHDLRDVTVTGGVADAEGRTGWGLVLAGAREAEGVTRDVVGLTALGNEAGGVVVAGAKTPRLVDVTATDNGVCGICWLELAAGSLIGASVQGNQLGLSVAGAASPDISDAVVEQNAEVGLIVEGGASPTLRNVELRENGGVGLAVREDAKPFVDGLVSIGHTEAGVLVEGAARPVLSGLTVGDAVLGVFIRGAAVADVRDAAVSGVADASYVFGEESGGTVADDVTCDAATFGIVLLDATTVEVADGSCEVMDQR